VTAETPRNSYLRRRYKVGRLVLDHRERFLLWGGKPRKKKKEGGCAGKAQFFLMDAHMGRNSKRTASGGS